MLFFEVQKPLEDDETMDIRTSTMIVGTNARTATVSDGKGNVASIDQDTGTYNLTRNGTVYSPAPTDLNEFRNLIDQLGL